MTVNRNGGNRVPAMKPPPGYVGMTDAVRITGVSAQTITLAAKLGELEGVQLKKGSPWFFAPEDLRRWRGIKPLEAVAS